MKKMLNRALSVLFAILTIVSLCTSPIMAEEVETYAGCTHTYGRTYLRSGYSFSQFDANDHERNTIDFYTCDVCDDEFGVVRPGSAVFLSHEYKSSHPTNDGSWTYQQVEYHSGNFHYYLYQTHCLYCGQAHTAYYFMKCTMCLPTSPF